MSPSIGHPTDLAVGTWTKVTGSRKPTTLLTNRAWFCCLLRPQIASLRFPTRVPCSPFALRVCLQALCGDERVQMQMGLGRTPRTFPAGCFVTHSYFTCFVLASRTREFAGTTASTASRCNFSSPAAR